MSVSPREEKEWLDFISPMRGNELNEELIQAAADGSAEHTAILLERGADPDYASGTALGVASAGGLLEVMELLLAKKPGDEIKATVLQTAVTANRPESVKLLLSHGADPSKDNSVSLWYTAMNGQTEIADMLLTAGADVHASNNALMGLALSRRNGETALVFLRHGADPSAEFKGKNAFEWAAEMHMEDVFKKLRSYVASDVYMGPEFFKSKSLGELRGVLPQHKDRTGFHVAAAAGVFDVIVEKILSTPGETMRAEDLLKEVPPIGPSVLVVLGQTGQLKDAFDPRLWAGRKQEMLDIFLRVPQAYRPQVDIDAVSTAIDVLALKNKQRKFTLKP